MKELKDLSILEKTTLLKLAYPKGTRVKLYTVVGKKQMEFGLEGTVERVDDIGQIHVNWDNGSTLALQDHDSYSVIS